MLNANELQLYKSIVLCLLIYQQNTLYSTVQLSFVNCQVYQSRKTLEPITAPRFRQFKGRSVGYGQWTCSPGMDIKHTHVLK